MDEKEQKNQPKTATREQYVFVRTFRGKTITISYLTEETVHSFKQKIQDVEGYPLDTFSVQFGSQLLQPEKLPMSEFHLESGETLHVVSYNRHHKHITSRYVCNFYTFV